MTELSIVIFVEHFFTILIICAVFECLERVIQYTKTIIIKYLIKYPGTYNNIYNMYLMLYF